MTVDRETASAGRARGATPPSDLETPPKGADPSALAGQRSPAEGRAAPAQPRHAAEIAARISALAEPQPARPPAKSLERVRLALSVGRLRRPPDGTSLAGLVLLLLLAAAPTPDGAYDIYNVRIRSLEGGKAQLVLETTGDVQYRDVFSRDPDRLTVDLMSARLATPAAEALVSRGGVRGIQLSQTSNEVVRLVVDFEDVDNYAIYEEGNDLAITFDNVFGAFAEYDMARNGRGAEAGPALEAGGAEEATRPAPEPAVADNAAAPAVRAVAAPAQTGASLGAAVERPAAAGAPAPADNDGLPQIEGAPISVDFQNADIQTVIRSFAEFGGVSIVAGAQVTGSITATIHDMPWDQALVSIMRANGYEVAYENGIIRIDSIANLRAVEQLQDLETRVIPLSFVSARDVVQTVDKFRSLRGAITADAKTNTIIITDVPGRVTQIVSVIDQLDVQTRQVTIKAKIVFVNKTDLLQFGITWRAENLRNPLTDTHLLANTQGAQTANDPFLTLSIATVASGVTVGGLLNVLEQRQLADVQAEPQTTVLNNLPAEIFVGERTPIRVLDVGADQAAASATVQLIETGIILDVTPHITPTGKVLMELHAERSGVAVNDPAVGVTFNTQRARTQILVNNGETAVIGGLTVQDISKNRSGIPLLMDIPILGHLFSRTEERKEKRDLLIFVTPYVVPSDDARPGLGDEVGTGAEAGAEAEAGACLQGQDWYVGDRPVLHSGARWVRFGEPRGESDEEFYVVGNFRGITIYADPDTVKDEIYLPACGADGLYQAYRRETEVRGTNG
ncbi:MAG TPA: secretin N-terminal domain-containing protein [Gemmatimonadota bacterium]|jgi:type IV pilus assembly protein PilQ